VTARRLGFGSFVHLDAAGRPGPVVAIPELNDPVDHRVAARTLLSSIDVDAAVEAH